MRGAQIGPLYNCGKGADVTHERLSNLFSGFAEELHLNIQGTVMIPAKSFRQIQLYVEEPLHYKFSCKLDQNAEMAFYGRKGLQASHTKVSIAFYLY